MKCKLEEASRPPAAPARSAPYQRESTSQFYQFPLDFQRDSPLMLVKTKGNPLSFQWESRSKSLNFPFGSQGEPPRIQREPPFKISRFTLKSKVIAVGFDKHLEGIPFENLREMHRIVKVIPFEIEGDCLCE